MPEKIFRNIHEIFSSTVQGEGAHAGRICSFLRLYGCPVGCEFCDTGYSKQDKHGKDIKRFNISANELKHKLQEDFVVISGGEPATHPQFREIVTFVLNLRGKKEVTKSIAIETSGTRFFDFNSENQEAKEKHTAIWVTVSPKMHLAPDRYRETSYVMWAVADEIKFIIRNKDDLDFYLPMIKKFQSVQKNKKNPTKMYLQPEWSVREQALPLIIDFLRQYPFFRLSTQTHKFLGLD